MAINIDYTTIDYDALKNEVVKYLQETNSFKDANFKGSNLDAMVGMYAYFSSLMGYYINSAANEPFIQTAKQYKNMNRISKLLSYNPRGDVSSKLDVVCSLNPQYCFGKEDVTFTVPAYSSFPSNKQTPDNQNFIFTNPYRIEYMIRSFGVKKVEQTDFTYDGISLPITKPREFWGLTESTSANPGTFVSSKLELTCSDTKPLSILNRLDSSKYKGFDTANVPLFDGNNASSVGQPFIRNIKTEDTQFDLIEGSIYYVVWNFDKEISAPYLTILEEGELLEERRDDIITTLQLSRDDVDGNYFTLKEVQNNAKGRFYLGILGMENLSSVSWDYTLLEGTSTSIKQIHLDINKSGDKPPFYVLVDGEIYSFTTGRISSQIFDVNNWDINVPFYNVNLQIVSPDKSSNNYDAELNVTTKEPKLNEVTIAKIYTNYTDIETNTTSLKRQSGNRYGNFQVVPESSLLPSEQKSGIVKFSPGVRTNIVQFSNPFETSTEPVEYIVSLTPTNNVRVWYKNVNENGFDITVEDDVSFDGDVHWLVTRVKKTESRSIPVVFDTIIPQIDGEDVDYTVFLSASDNIQVWFTENSNNGFNINVEKAFSGTVSWSIFVNADNENVLQEQNNKTQKTGIITLNQNDTTGRITFDVPFDTDNYGLHFVPNTNVNVWYTNKSSNGFTINIESASSGNVDIHWFADYNENYVYQKHGMVNFSGQITSVGTLPGIRFSHINETFKISNLVQGSILFSYINKNGVIDTSNNTLKLSAAIDRRNLREVKVIVDQPNISYEDIRVFVKNDASEWEEWDNASSLVKSTTIHTGDKVYFVRVNEYKKIEISFGDGELYGVNPYNHEIIIFGMQTVGSYGNIPPNTLSQSIILSQEILGDDNITIQFESQFIDLIGLKNEIYFSASTPLDSTVIYDSEGTKLTINEMKIKQNRSSFGGNNIETVDEIRENAPLANLRQDRIVSLDDYKTFINQTFNKYITKSQVLSYKEVVDAEFLPTFEMEKYWFNHVFIIALPVQGLTITKQQKQYILDSLKSVTKSMLNVEPELFSAQLVPIDFRIKFKKTKLGQSNIIKSEIRKRISDYMEKDNRNIGEELYHSDIISTIKSINHIEYVECAINTDKDNKYSEDDYDIDAVTNINESVEEVKRRKILELLSKEGILKIAEPLLDITNSETQERQWVFSSNIQLNKYEFPILGDIIIEEVM